MGSEQWCSMLQAETRVILNERILLDEAQARAAQAETRQGEGDINTDDDDDDTAEYEHWHQREMARIARCKAHTQNAFPSTWQLSLRLLRRSVTSVSQTSVPDLVWQSRGMQTVLVGKHTHSGCVVGMC